jgi:hypothetical protein
MIINIRNIICIYTKFFNLLIFLIQQKKSTLYLHLKTMIFIRYLYKKTIGFKCKNNIIYFELFCLLLIYNLERDVSMFKWAL